MGCAPQDPSCEGNYRNYDEKVLSRWAVIADFLLVIPLQKSRLRIDFVGNRYMKITRLPIGFWLEISIKYNTWFSHNFQEFPVFLMGSWYNTNYMPEVTFCSIIPLGKKRFAVLLESFCITLRKSLPYNIRRSKNRFFLFSRVGKIFVFFPFFPNSIWQIWI